MDWPLSLEEDQTDVKVPNESNTEMVQTPASDWWKEFYKEGFGTKIHTAIIPLVCDL